MRPRGRVASFFVFVGWMVTDRVAAGPAFGVADVQRRSTASCSSRKRVAPHVARACVKRSLIERIVRFETALGGTRRGRRRQSAFFGQVDQLGHSATVHRGPSREAPRLQHRPSQGAPAGAGRTGKRRRNHHRGPRWQAEGATSPVGRGQRKATRARQREGAFQGRS